MKILAPLWRGARARLRALVQAVLPPNWKDILKRSWSLRWIALFVLVTAGQEIFPYVADVVPRWVGPLLGGLAFVARLLKQKGLSVADAPDDEEEPTWV